MAALSDSFYNRGLYLSMFRCHVQISAIGYVRTSGVNPTTVNNATDNG